jgi:hypothetical protein
MERIREWDVAGIIGVRVTWGKPEKNWGNSVGEYYHLNGDSW